MSGQLLFIFFYSVLVLGFCTRCCPADVSGAGLLSLTQAAKGGQSACRVVDAIGVKGQAGGASLKKTFAVLLPLQEFVVDIGVSGRGHRSLVGGVGRLHAFVSSTPRSRGANGLLSCLSSLRGSMGNGGCNLIFRRRQRSISRILSARAPMLARGASLFVSGNKRVGFLVRKSGLTSLGLLRGARGNGVSLVCVSPPCGARGRSFVCSSAFISTSSLCERDG